MADVLVIGAGLAGLSAACHLRGRGHQVTVVERGSGPGGRAGRSTHGGFTFDTGPTVMTMPGLLDDALQAVGTSVADLVPMRVLDPAYRARFHDGSEIRVRHGHEAMREEIRRTCGDRDAVAFDRFVAWLRELYAVEMPHYIDRNFNSPLDLARPWAPRRPCCGSGGCGGSGPRSAASSTTGGCTGCSPSRRCMPGCPRRRPWRSTP